MGTMGCVGNGHEVFHTMPMAASNRFLVPIKCRNTTRTRVRTSYVDVQQGKHPCVRVASPSPLTWALGRHLFRLLGRSEEDGLAGGAAAAHADALDVDDVLGVPVQVPQGTGARGGVHLLDEPQHADVLLLQHGEGFKLLSRNAGALVTLVGIVCWSVVGGKKSGLKASRGFRCDVIKLREAAPLWPGTACLKRTLLSDWSCLFGSVGSCYIKSRSPSGRVYLPGN